MSESNGKAVEVRGLEKRFGDFRAVDRISFDVSRGEIFGFLGPNGAGKSTTIRMLCGILTPSAGWGRVGGFDIVEEQEKIKQNIGYMSQRFSLYDDLTVEENIEFYCGIYGVGGEKRRQREEWVIEMAGLRELRGALTRTLAAGWKQRLALGCALLHEPKILFLDEPTSGVDPIARRSFWDLIKQMAGPSTSLRAGGGVTVFVTTHYMDEAENCDRMALIYRGSIIAMGTSAELKTRYMSDEVVETTIAGAAEWLERVGAVEGVKEAALFGDAIHAVVGDAEKAVSAIELMLAREKGSGYAVRRIEPTLEDVFVSLIESHDRAGGGG